MYFTGGCRFISFFGGVCVFVFVDKIQMQVFLGVPLNGQTCVWETHGCALLLWRPFIWTFSFSACISVREYIEYPVYRIDNGGSTESREGDTESQTGYMHTR